MSKYNPEKARIKRQMAKLEKEQIKFILENDNKIKYNEKYLQKMLTNAQTNNDILLELRVKEIVAISSAKLKLEKTAELKVDLKHQEFLKRMQDTFGDKYTVLGKFYNVSTPVLIRHNECGYEWSPYPSHLFSDQSRCPQCSGKVPYTNESFNKILKEKYNGEYELIGEIKRANLGATIRHNLCGRERKVIPSNFLDGRGFCTFCYENKSTGENAVNEFLVEKNVNFTTQYSFEDCKNLSRLRFDFVIFNKDSDLICLIEFDGVQHFKPIGYFGGEEGFLKQQEKDKIKNEYCKENNIPLLRIPHWEAENVSSIITDFLSELNHEI